MPYENSSLEAAFNELSSRKAALLFQEKLKECKGNEQLEKAVLFAWGRCRHSSFSGAGCVGDSTGSGGISNV